MLFPSSYNLIEQLVINFINQLKNGIRTDAEILQL